MDMHPSALTKFWGMKIDGVIHAGAHKGEEASLYSGLGFGPVTWIEAIPKLAMELSERVKYPSEVINATLWCRANERMTFKITSSTGSSSLFELLEHKSEYPQILVEEEIEVSTTTLDLLNLGSEKNLLVLDLQGAEYEALIGAETTLTKIDYILIEVNRAQLYKGIKLVGDLDTLLRKSSFVRVATRWTRFGWGEALYVRVPRNQTQKFVSFGLSLKKFVFWCWLHFIEIPVVYIRGRLKYRFTSQSKVL